MLRVCYWADVQPPLREYDRRACGGTPSPLNHARLTLPHYIFCGVGVICTRAHVATMCCGALSLLQALSDSARYALSACCAVIKPPHTTDQHGRAAELPRGMPWLLHGGSAAADSPRERGGLVHHHRRERSALADVQRHARPYVSGRSEPQQPPACRLVAAMRD